MSARRLVTGLGVAALGAAAAVAAGGVVAIGIGLTGYGITKAAGASGRPPTVHCRAGTSRPCLHAVRARVTGRTWADDLVVRSPDGSFRHEIDLVANDHLPPKGTTVELERWKGDIVGVYDPQREVRWRTPQWPRGGHDVAVGIVATAAGIVIALGTGAGVAAAFRRRRADVAVPA